MIRMSDLHDEDGFTLIELMVVVTILAVLLLMSVSTFIGVKKRASDSAAKQMAATTLEIARVVFTDHATYANATPTELMAAEPSLDAVPQATNSSGPGSASVFPDPTATGNTFVAAVYSGTGRCFFIRDWIGGVGIGFAVDDGVAAADCRADRHGSVSFLIRWPAG